MEYNATVIKSTHNEGGLSGLYVRFEEKNVMKEGFILCKNLKLKEKTKKKFISGAVPTHLSPGATIKAKIIRSDGEYNDLVQC